MDDTLEDLVAKIRRRPCAIDQLRDEAKKLPELVDTIRALAAFAKSLAPEAKYWIQGERYVLYPNFVAFTVRHKRSHHLTITLRGNIGEFDGFSELPLKEGRAGSYADCNLRSPKELAAAAAYIQRAYQIYQRGGARVRKKIVKTEVPVSKR